MTKLNRDSKKSEWDIHTRMEAIEYQLKRIRGGALILERELKELRKDVCE